MPDLTEKYVCSYLSNNLSPTQTAQEPGETINNFNHLIRRTKTHKTLTKVLQNVLALG